MNLLIIAILVILIFIILFKLFVNYSTGECKSDVRLDNKTVVITGADKGIGYETALDLAGRGARVVMACRDLENANKMAATIKKETGNESVVVMKIDLSSLQSVRQFAKAFLEKEHSLHVLINNAGIPESGERTEEGFERVFVVNYLGHFLLTHLLKGILKRSSPSRVVNVSSLHHYTASQVKPSDLDHKSYPLTKALQVLHAFDLNRQLEGDGVMACSVHPGLVWNANFFRKASRATFLLLHLVYPFTKSARQGAQTSIFAAVDSSRRVQAGKFHSDCAPFPSRSFCSDPALAKKVYESSERYCGIV